MIQDALGGLVGFLALLGAAVLALRLFRAAARVVLSAAEVATSAGLAEASARRGDLTALAESRAAERVARASQRRHGLIALVWLLWLVVPLVAGGALEMYAIAAPLWLLPSRPVRPPTRAAPPP
jgi:hypothetical protein